MRNKSLDAVKAIAACLVVCIHVSFPGQAGQLVKVLARCAVPFFFMVFLLLSKLQCLKKNIV